MARRRFFVDQVRNGRAELAGEGAEHLRRVLRAAPGDRLEISDNRSVYLAEIEGFRKGAAILRLLEPLAVDEPALRITLLASLIKFDRFEWIIEKATELGAGAIVPVAAARSERGLERAAAKRLERWRRIALESSQQCRRARLPAIEDAADFAHAVRTRDAFRYLLDEESSGPALAEALPPAGERPAAARVSLLLGPEGGWTGGERQAAIEAGWTRVSLGPTILRAETAAIAALAVLRCVWPVGRATPPQPPR